jgi:predicted methyltransferase
MKRIACVVTALACSLAFAGNALAQIPDYVAKGVADPGRAQDAKNDARRKGAEIVAFSTAKPGDKVLELIPGGGYFTRVFSKVVGPQGRVYAVWPTEYDEKPDKVKEIAKDYGNVDLLMQPAAKLTAPQPVDVVFTSQNYHDYPDKFMGPTDLAILNAAVFAVLKPGGVYVIVDHSGEPGSGVRDTDTLHRIDEAAVKQQVVAAGFEYVGESDVLRNKSDDRKTNVFNPAIRGRTDQFVYKFRKPLK